jgi:hypothetical protein
MEIFFYFKLVFGLNSNFFYNILILFEYKDFLLSFQKIFLLKISFISTQVIIYLFLIFYFFF